MGQNFSGGLYLTVLNQTVNDTLDSGRIGSPVFVRWTASVAESKDVLKAQLAEMTVYTNRWLAANLHRLYATGSETQGHLSLALEYATGSSALLALTLAHNRPYMNLAIYGNQGAIYHDDFIVPTRSEGANRHSEAISTPFDDGSLASQQAGSNREPTIHQDALVIREAIDQSLAVRQPIVLTHSGGQP